LARSLYICYFGANQPLVQTQVIPYLRELVKGGHEMSLLTFEPGEVDEKTVREELAADGIAWHWLRYHKRPSVPATMFDIANGARFIRKLNAERAFDMLHARSHVPMMMAALTSKFSTRRPRLLFDIRGFLPEEYVDAGVWSEGGAIYRWVKRIEARLMKGADGFVVLTEEAREIIEDQVGSRPLEVIPCCVDFERRFSGDHASERERIRKQFGIEGRFVIVHLGALGGLYLTDKMADLLAAARSRDKSVFALFLTQSDPDLIVPLLKSRGFGDEDLYVGRVPAQDVEGYLHASDVGLSFVKATFATQSRSPTKIPEYLACGVPVVANAGVGDIDTLLSGDKIGVIADDLSEAGHFQTLDALEGLMQDADLADRCRAAAAKRFDLKSVGGERYRRVYQELTSRNEDGSI